jgi:hypothetical protein
LVTSSFVFALALATTAGQLTAGDLLPGRPPPATQSYFAESPWEFGAEGSPSVEATTFDSSLSAALAPEGGFGAPAASGCGVCCAGISAVDRVCLGGFVSRSVSNTIYFTFVGAALGCFGGVLLGIIPAFILATVVGAFVTNVGGLIAGTLLGCGGLGCMAGGAIGAPLGFFSTSIFPWWAPPPQQTTVIIDGGGSSNPPPRARRRRPRAAEEQPKVEHREERKTDRDDSGRRSRRNDNKRRSRSNDDDDDGRSNRRGRSPRR